MKFGGSSVADVKNINKVIDIVLNSRKKNESIVVVTSALGGITDELITLATLASKRDPKHRAIFQKICKRHDQLIKNLIKSKFRTKTLFQLERGYAELEKIIKKMTLSEKIYPASLDAVMSFGERLSSFIIGEAIRDRGIKCKFVDTREIIKTDDNFGNANVDIETSYKSIANFFLNLGEIKFPLSIMGGFIASTKSGVTTTLGRGGSDYTAALVGAALNASVVEIWTDVDGLMTADPNKVKNARTISDISYEQAEEMALAGAKVIHPKTMQPARERGIPIFIKNTFNPTNNGTKISNDK
jgi:aspartokinase/homoserine dehydrogenase 1